MQSNHTELEEKLLKAVHKQFKQVKDSYRNYYNNPYRPEHIHRLRVDMRKTRTLLNFLKPIINEEIYERFNQGLRDLGQQLSPLRDLDTLIEECTEVATKEPNLIENYADVFRFLEKERLKLIKSQSTKKAFEHFKGILEGAEGLLKGLTFQLEDSKETVMEDFIENRYKHKIKTLQKQYSNLNESNYEAVHDVRKQAKKVRYTSSGFKKVLPKKIRKTQKRKAKKIQEHLGTITDAHVSLEIMEEYKKKAPNSALKKAFQTIINHYQN